MAEKNNSALFYTCSLIEYIGRYRKLRRGEVVSLLGEETIHRIYTHAGVLHCEPVAKVADDFVTMYSLPEGGYDNVASCRYTVPDYWTIGEVYERLIEDVCPGDDTNDIIRTLISVYTSWIDPEISNYNSDLFYQPRDYLRECFLAGEIIE